ncbi:type II CAAX endopeptidase family protein [Ichthyenterobacterium sp. W332]|uniref:Type II CAAX endopeptidase family protein n=1 Tax=Microcosmobacter mediterraneus TaxID=3075607 RepID=A0ABU2YKB8_9FLAO|nr:type II CAAX endopeptidase family protein [Ichthyenterobacterium sp. W332]MDT0558134.1 type II CAAX endopeptidase family protein [Ichthyenterobacterium sp. W332]
MHTNIECKQCHKQFVKAVNFCGFCGASIQSTKVEKRNIALNLVIVFFITFLLFALAVYLINERLESSLVKELVIELAFASLVIGFSLFDWKAILKTYKVPKLSGNIWAWTFIIPILSSIVVYYFVNAMNTILFGDSDYSYFESYLYLDNPLPWAIFFVAILPPIFEELAFRGFLFNQLQKIVSERMTIVGTAFLFALVHFSLISFLWIFPFGLLLGYLRSKYKTLWLGIIIHFIHNLIIILWDYYDYQNLIHFLE